MPKRCRRALVLRKQIDCNTAECLLCDQDAVAKAVSEDDPITALCALFVKSSSKLTVGHAWEALEKHVTGPMLSKMDATEGKKLVRESLRRLCEQGMVRKSWGHFVRKSDDHLLHQDKQHLVERKSSFMADRLRQRRESLPPEAIIVVLGGMTAVAAPTKRKGGLAVEE